MTLQKFVIENQKIIELVQDRVPGQEQVDMYYGTLDYATARFNTILIKLSQDKILEQIHSQDTLDCFNAIQDSSRNIATVTFTVLNTFSSLFLILLIGIEAHGKPVVYAFFSEPLFIVLGSVW
tara:strand:+ start:467 stop:835 length:369 start_codon:yes stop_codon:yes gene_type:complete